MKGKQIVYIGDSSMSYVIKRMAVAKANGYIRRGVFSNEIVWGKKSYIFSPLPTKKKKIFYKGMFLFGMVRKDAKLWLRNNTVKLPKKYPSVEYSKSKTSEDLSGTIAGTDLNHAYWRIAFNLGIISSLTYVKGLPDEFKSVRLAALSTMGSKKKYQKIQKGVITDDYYLEKGDEELQKVYTLIRYTCYKYMARVKKMLGTDFLAYKTDAIYYMNTRENKKLVREFFKENDLLMKQLT